MGWSAFLSDHLLMVKARAAVYVSGREPLVRLRFDLTARDIVTRRANVALPQDAPAMAPGDSVDVFAWYLSSEIARRRRDADGT